MANELLPNFTINLTDLVLRKTDHIPFQKLPGFTRGRHFVPDKANSRALAWAQSLLREELGEELQLVYQNSKDELGLRHGQVKKEVGEGGGSVETPFFLFTIRVEQDETDFERVTIFREIQPRGPTAELPPRFDLVFPQTPDEVVLSVDGALSFDDLVEKFEAMRAQRGGRLRDDSETGQIRYTTQDGNVEMLVETKKSEMVIHSRSHLGALALLGAIERI